MNSTTLHSINIAASFSALLFCMFELLSLGIWFKRIGKEAKFSLATILINIVALLSNMLGLIFKGTGGKATHVFLQITSFFEFALAYVLAFMLTAYIFNLIEKNGGKVLGKKVMLSLYALPFLFLVVSQSNGLLYYIDSANYYHRGKLLIISQLFAVSALVVDFFVVMIYRKFLTKTQLAATLTYILSPIVSVPQLFNYGPSLFYLSTTFGITIVFLITLSDNIKTGYQAEKEIDEMKVRIMTSQIQPHFLYNSLVSIKYLCKKDPQKAAQAVEDFAFYLRGNMNALSCDHCIAFEIELSHVKTYLELEKMRFGNRLSVEYDIQNTDFVLPPLSVQPIVENAVKYGVTQRVEGVNVQISTYCDEKYNCVKVSDNGVGFDVEHFKSDGKPHIGIDAVVKRLDFMCGGKLEIESKENIGTVAIIKIPKNQKDGKTK